MAQESELGPRRGGLAGPGWDEVHLVHQSLPELALNEIDLSTAVAGVRLGSPVIINAMTGGAPGVEAINRDLAVAARELGLAMALGSQTAGLKEPAVASTYRVVREVNPGGVFLANVSAEASVAQARAAVEMVEADLLQIHLNAPQELQMAEGDRDFRGQIERISLIVQELEVPVVVKECGFGLSKESTRLLYQAGVRAVDLSGRGGTNFAWIEMARREGEDLDPGLTHWGIPTACALAEVAALELPGLDLIASGGIAYGSEAAKALALGACAVGVAGGVLKRQQEGGLQATRRYLERLLDDLRAAVLLAGARDLPALQRRPVVLTGGVGEWCRLRGVDLTGLANRT
ncbi:MAG: type 2 isopentenyl-diphosphate Delta-isomerase [Bacillota bacterium]